MNRKQREELGQQERVEARARQLWGGGYREGEEGWGEVPSMDCQERSCAPFLSGRSPSGSPVSGLGTWAYGRIHEPAGGLMGADKRRQSSQ